MLKAITAIILGFLVVAAIWWLPLPAFNTIILLVAFLGAIEFGKMFFQDPFERWITILTTVFSAYMTINYAIFASAFPLILAGELFVFSFLFMLKTKTLDGVASRLSIAMLSVIYLGVAFPIWSWIREMPFGASMVLLILAPACLCDTVAYIVGKAIGKHKFAPKVSPNKTWEGFAGALIGSLAGVFLIRWLLLPNLELVHTVGLALIIWITSPIGDLVESMFKRSCGVKDSGTIVPGHGGVLDRLDALIFTGPAAFAYIKYLIM